MSFEGNHIILTPVSVSQYTVILQRASFQDNPIMVMRTNYFVPESTTETITDIEQLDNSGGRGHIIPADYKIKPLGNAIQGSNRWKFYDEVVAVTGWDNTTELTFAQLEAAATASPAIGTAGHIELVYYDNTPSNDNIIKIKITLTDLSVAEINY